MFSLDPIHPLYTAILEILSASPGISIASLHQTLQRRKVDITLQHVYRIVNRLVEDQILIKSDTTLSINLMWLSYLEFFADRAKKSLLGSKEFMNMFPLKEGERRTFKVDNLLDLQTLWNHLLIQLNRSVQEKFLLKYYSHTWWQLGRYALDPAFYKRIKEIGVRCFWVFGNTTFLDTHAAKIHRDLMDVRLVEDPPFPQEGYNLNIYGEHILECIFPEKISRHFEFIFHNVITLKQFDEEVYTDLFSLRCPMTLKLWRSEKQSRDLRMKIEQYFVKPGK